MRDFDIVRFDTFRVSPDCLPPDVSKVRTKDGLSVFDVIMSNGAVFQLIETYHAEKSSFSRNTHHQHKAMSLVSMLDLFFGEAFEILTDSIDMEVVSGWLRGGAK